MEIKKNSEPAVGLRGQLGIQLEFKANLKTRDSGRLSKLDELLHEPPRHGVVINKGAQGLKSLEAVLEKYGPANGYARVLAPLLRAILRHDSVINLAPPSEYILISFKSYKRRMDAGKYTYLTYRLGIFPA